MNDTFMEDLAQEPEALENECYSDDGGGRYWPHLVFALPFATRPLLMDLRTPPGPGPHKLLVYIHGGGWVLGTPKYNNPTLRTLQVPERLIAAGYAVAQISYRLAGEAPFPASLHDCKAAIRYLRAKAQVFDLDPERVAVLGESAGGHLATMVAFTGDNPEFEGDMGVTEGSSAVLAAINWYGATDLVTLTEKPINPDGPMMQDGLRPEEMLVGGPRTEKLEALVYASPITHVHAAAPPILHQHGTSDRMVGLQQSEALHAALKAKGVHSELDVIEGADHCFWGGNSPAIMDRAIVFLDANV